MTKIGSAEDPDLDRILILKKVKIVTLLVILLWGGKLFIALCACYSFSSRFIQFIHVPNSEKRNPAVNVSSDVDQTFVHRDLEQSSNTPFLITPPKSILRVIGAVGVSNSLTGRNAAFALQRLLQRTINEKLDPSNPNSNVNYIIFAGNLFSFYDLPSSRVMQGDDSPSKLLSCFVRGVTGLQFWGSSMSHITELKPLLMRLRNLGVTVYWLIGSQEMNLNQEILESLNWNKPVPWIQIPSKKDFLSLHRTFISSGRNFDFLAAPLKESYELPFSFYIERLHNKNSFHPASPGVTWIPSEWSISRRALLEAVATTATMTMALIENEDWMETILKRTFEMASGANVTKPRNEIIFTDGHWNRSFDSDGEMKTINSRKIGANEIIRHYSNIGKDWLQFKGPSETANVFYATAYGDLETVLDMAHATDDVAIVGHLGESSITRYPSGRVVSYIDQWRTRESVRNQISKKETTSTSTATIEPTNSDSRVIDKVFHQFKPRLGYVDVTTEHIYGISESVPFLSWERSAESWSLVLIRCALGSALVFPIVAIVTVVALRQRKVTTVLCVEDSLLKSIDIKMQEKSEEQQSLLCSSQYEKNEIKLTFDVIEEAPCLQRVVYEDGVIDIPKRSKGHVLIA